MRDSGDPRSPAARLEFVDSLRGFALFGVFWANLLIFSGIDYMTDGQRASLFGGPLDTLAYFLEQLFIENKFMGLFSFLFGISFWLFLNRVRSRGASPTTLFYRRIFWLFAIGAIHGWLLWCFDVLRFYALWAVLLPLFVRTTPRRLLRVAMITAVLLPALVAAANVWLIRPAAADLDATALAAFSAGSYREVLAANWRYDWYLTNSISQIGYQVAIFGRLLLGLYVARSLDLANLAADRTLLRRVLVVGAAAGLVGNTIFAGDLLSGTRQSFAGVRAAVSCRRRPARADIGLRVGAGVGFSGGELETRDMSARSDRADGADLVSAPDGLRDLDVLRVRTGASAHGKGRTCVARCGLRNRVWGADRVCASLDAPIPIRSGRMVLAKPYVRGSPAVQIPSIGGWPPTACSGRRCAPPLMPSGLACGGGRLNVYDHEEGTRDFLRATVPRR